MTPYIYVILKSWSVKFEHFEKNKEVPLESVPRNPYVQYLSTKTIRKKTPDDHNNNRQQKTDRRDDSTRNANFAVQLKSL